MVVNEEFTAHPNIANALISRNMGTYSELLTAGELVTYPARISSFPKSCNYDHLLQPIFIPKVEVIVCKYRKEWPLQAEKVKADIAADLSDAKVRYLRILHVGSTSVPGLSAKPILDFLIVIDAFDFRHIIKQHFIGALCWGTHPGSWRFNGDGGVKNRWSFSLPGVEPRRSLNVVAEGSMVLKSYIDVKDTLIADPALREEYGRVKKDIAKSRELRHIRDYSVLKNGIIRKILRKAGWTDLEVDERQGDAVSRFTLETVDIYLP